GPDGARDRRLRDGPTPRSSWRQRRTLPRRPSDTIGAASPRAAAQQLTAPRPGPYTASTLTPRVLIDAERRSGAGPEEWAASVATTSLERHQWIVFGSISGRATGAIRDRIRNQARRPSAVTGGKHVG